VGLVPTRETIERAFALADGQPRTVGELSYLVCQVLGVDTTGCDAYRLRHRFPYQTYVTLLRRMVRDGEAVVKTRRDWRALSRGAFCPDGREDTVAYVSAEAARQIRAALRAAGPSQPRARWELALHLARQRVLREREAEVHAYASAWMKDQDRATQGGGGNG
jgi:hypothetical protein